MILLNKNLFFFLFALFITLLVIDVKPASAVQIVKKEGTAILSGPNYNAARDAYVVIFDKQVVTHNMHRHYTDSSLSRVGYENYVTVKANWTGEQYLNCKRWTEEIYYNSSGQVVGHLIFYADELKNDTCESNYNDPSEEGSSPVDCGEAICKCIFELEGAVGKVEKSVNSNGEKLETINKSINVGNGILGDIAKQVTTGKSIVDAPDVTIKQPTVKPVTGLPNVPDAFEDTGTHFKDAGDAPEKAGKLPDSPDIAECWDKTEDVTCKQDKGTPEKELQKDKQQEKDKDRLPDKELEKDSFNQEKELEKDSFSKESPMSAEPNLSRDSFKQDSEMDKESFNRDSIMDKEEFQHTDTFKKGAELDQTNFYKKTDN